MVRWRPSWPASSSARRQRFGLSVCAAGVCCRISRAAFGALLFGRLGDLIGRKYTFLVTILIAGLATFAVAAAVLRQHWRGCATGADRAAPAAGLALGVNTAGRRCTSPSTPRRAAGAPTPWIQTTATLGLLMALLVVLGTRTVLGRSTFADWGWRIPFLVSIVLLGISVWIRLALAETPAFRRMKARGRGSRPIDRVVWPMEESRLVALLCAGG